MDDQQILSLNTAPSWAIWTGDIGRALVLLGAASFVIALLGALFSNNKPSLARLSSLSFVLGAACLLGAFVSLASLFARDQFEFQYVFSHGDALTELKYKIAGVWSGQQGSFLLWACTSAIFLGVLALRATGIYRRWCLSLPMPPFSARFAESLHTRLLSSFSTECNTQAKSCFPIPGTALLHLWRITGSSFTLPRSSPDSDRSRFSSRR